MGRTRLGSVPHFPARKSPTVCTGDFYAVTKFHKSRFKWTAWQFDEPEKEHGIIEVIRNNGNVVSEQILDNTNAYLAAYVVIVILSFLIISLDGFSTGTNISAVLCTFNNIGPGLEAVGPTCNFSEFSILSKLVLSLDMLAGRLEIFPMLVLFSRNTWKKR